jgi:hypothetical protein
MAQPQKSARKAGSGPAVSSCRIYPRNGRISDPELSIILSYHLSIPYRSPVVPPVCLTPYNPL